MNTLYNNFCFTFSKKNDGNNNITNNFTVKEFACKDGSDPVFINAAIPLICQAVRNWFGYPYSPNSAYRTPHHNAASGGSVGSFHIYGKAVDIPAGAGVTPKELYDFLDKLCGNSCEIGIYNWGVHVAITGTKKRFIDKSYKG